ncbi:biotin transporter BioY [Thalassobius sp. S69A]|uniref:biotin transporter BioY n=1 Tax=unclassified Thalassovita TaxID=2619711 RepID=UPI000C0D2861|nr:BioY family transporter [Paracoccaceae bacterium]MBT25154.1 BioY family transporter [Paracoccaceae bacterium]
MERNIVLIALFAALIAALGLIPKITLASGIPITAQSMGIMLCGTVLGAKRGALAVILFLGLVALGLPLLAGGRGGLGVFTTPWAGFLFGFPVAAFVAGLVMDKWKSGNTAVVAIVAAVIGGIGALYLVAIPYYMVMKPAPLGEALSVAMAPFMPGDLIKAVLAGLITQGVLKARPGLARV